MRYSTQDSLMIKMQIKLKLIIAEVCKDPSYVETFYQRKTSNILKSDEMGSKQDVQSSVTRNETNINSDEPKTGILSKYSYFLFFRKQAI